jgi:hypothetical protein
VELFVSGRLIALFVACAIAFGNIGAAAQPAAAAQRQAQTSAAEKNAPPLKPAGAAGINVAQGASDRGVLIVSGLILSSIVAAMLLVEDDDEDAVTTTGTN